MDEHAFYSRVVDSEVLSRCDVKYVLSFEIFLCHSDEAHYTLRSNRI